MNLTTTLRIATLTLAALASGGTPAQTAPGAAEPLRSSLAQGGDPYLPPAARKPPTQLSPSGAALQSKVDQKLRATFDAADAGRSGTLTREQAQRAGWGMVAQEFDRIDVKRAGRVSFEDIQRYLHSRSAAR